MNMVCYESGLFGTGLLWMGLLWMWSVLNGPLWVVCYERVCFECEPAVHDFEKNEAAGADFSIFLLAHLNHFVFEIEVNYPQHEKPKNKNS